MPVQAQGIFWRFRPARFLEGEGPQAGPVRLNLRRIFILPTRYGLLFGALLLVMLLGSINYGNSLGFLLTFLLGGLALVSILYTYLNLAGLEISAARCGPVFAGEPAAFAFHVSNPGNEVRHSVSFQLPGLPAEISDVAANEISTLQLLCPAPRRGVLKMGRFTIATRFPLGLFWAWSPLDLDLHCLVYPHPAAGYRPYPTGGDELDSGPGLKGGDDFAGLRAHQRGEPLHHIHWKLAAREQGLWSKQYGGGPHELWLEWDAVNEQDTEARLSQLCRWVLDAHTAALRYGLRLPGLTLPPAQGEAHRAACLRALALFGLPT